MVRKGSRPGQVRTNAQLGWLGVGVDQPPLDAVVSRPTDDRGTVVAGEDR